MVAITPEAALERLRSGNRRFLEGEGEARARRFVEMRMQMPFAAVLACSDSRVPVETVFDQGIGELFVVRVAGNIAGPSQIASIEFAVQQFEVPLVVVLGHTGCGAVRAALDESALDVPAHVASILKRIRGNLVPAPAMDSRDEDLEQRAVTQNVNTEADTLIRESSFLSEVARGNELVVIGALYSLSNGGVEFFVDETRK